MAIIIRETEDVSREIVVRVNAAVTRLDDDAVELERLHVRHHRVLNVVRDELIAVLHAPRNAVGRDLQRVGQQLDRGVGMRLAEGEAVQADVIHALRLRQHVAVGVEQGTALGRNRHDIHVILDRHAGEFIVLYELDLDEVERNQGEPAGQHDHDPDGAVAVLHDINCAPRPGGWRTRQARNRG